MGPQTGDLGNGQEIFKRRVRGGALGGSGRHGRRDAGETLSGEVQELPVGEQERRTAGQQQCRGRGDQRCSGGDDFGGRRSRHVATGAHDIVKFVPEVQK